MAKQLKIDEILQAMSDCGHPDYEAWKANIESAATLAGRALARHFRIGSGGGTFEGMGFAGLCVPFFELAGGQACPRVIHEQDPGGDWDGKDGDEIRLMDTFK
jgi:hypothetical protein